MITKISVNILVHIAACILLVALNDLAMYAYKEIYGAFGSRGVGPGLVTRFVLFLAVSINIIIALIPKKSIKLLGVAVFVLSTAYFLLPQYPLRTIFYCLTGGFLTTSAIYIANWINTFVSTRQKSHKTQ